MTLRRTSFFAKTAAALGLALLMAAATAPAAGPKVVNIVNFIRGTEPRSNVDLLQPVVEQIRLARQHHLPTTFLIQYDALVNPDFVNLLKSELGPDDEIGVWLEVVQPQVEAAGMVWRGRWAWDYNAAVGLTEAYTPAEREKLMDVLMERFKTEFGRYPRSAGCWVLDAPTLNYLSDKYGIVAACNCKDQSGTDGYTLWGGYWNQAYYPSRLNAFMPAQTLEQQLKVPVFRMLGSDPVYQYDHSLGSGLQGVISLEPVYRPGGGSPDWVRWFFDANFNAPNLSFAYAQAGQENSFGWPAMQAGLTDQYQLMAERVAAGSLRVETLEKSGAWYRENFDLTPATAVVAMNDYDNRGHRSIWYESRFYRVNFYWEGDAWRIRDLHVFNEKYAERYLKDRVTGPTCTYDTLPVMDGFHWSTANDLAGFRPLVNLQGGARQLLATGTPTVTELGTESLRIDLPVSSGGVLQILCEPARLKMEMTGAGSPVDWGLELGWSAQQTTSIVNSSARSVGYQHHNFGYALRTGDATISPGSSPTRLVIRPDAKTVSFDFDPAHAMSWWDLNGAAPGAGDAIASGVWNATAANWSAAADGTGDPASWPGEGHTAVFSAGGDATGASAVTVEGSLSADGVIVRTGQVTLSGGSLNLTTPAVVRAEAGAGLDLATPLVGTGGMLLEGEGAIHLSGVHPLAGPLGISSPSLTLGSGTRFPALSHVSLASGTSLAADGATLGLTGNLTLTGARFAATGATTVTAQNTTLTAAGLAPEMALSDTAALILTGVTPAQSTFEMNGGSLVLAGSSRLTADRWINRGSGQEHTVTISGEARLTLTDDFVLGGNAAAPITLYQTGGTVTNTGTTNNPAGDDASNRWGLWNDSADTVYTITGGSLNLTGAPLYLSWDSAATLTIAGTATVNLRGVNMGWSGRIRPAAIRLTGGRLNLGADGIVTGGTANKIIDLGGGTLGSMAPWSCSMPITLSGGVTVNTAGGDITLGGVLSGPGGLVKTGSGTLILGGANTFSGMATVNAGALQLGGSSGMKVIAAPGGTIAATGGASVATLNLADGSSSLFRLGGAGNPLTIATAGGFSAVGTHRVHVMAAPGLAPGTYPLFRYSGAIAGDGFAAFKLGATPGLTGSLVQNTATATVELLVTAVDPGGAEDASIRELFDGIAGTPPGINGTLNGKGDTATTTGLTGSWLTHGGPGISATSTADVGANLPGLPASGGVTGSLWNNTNGYGTTLYASRPLSTPIDFASDRTLYFSFRANNAGDSAMGVGLAAGADGSAPFVGAGLTWNNARALATGQIDSGNTSYVCYGALDAASGPYGIRNHGVAGAVNGPVLVVGRLGLHANGPDEIDIRHYLPGETIAADPSLVLWSASDRVDSAMNATHLLLWLNGGGNSTGELDAIRFGASWKAVTGAVDAYDRWVGGLPYFLAGVDASPTADPDRDGLSNVIEFVLGGDPTAPGDGDKLPVVMEAGDFLEVSFRRMAAARGLEPFVEYGPDLADWHPAQDGVDGVEVTAFIDFDEPGIDKVVVRIPLALAGGGKLFARLKVDR